MLLSEVELKTFFHEPSEGELNAGAQRRFATFGPFNIDRWPDEVIELSMPTKFIRIEDPRLFVDLFDKRTPMSEALRYAALIDDTIGWDNHFIRLNSRSPKDASFPVPPITNSGKQAISWILGSERCLDDIVTMSRVEAPVFICCREWRHIPPSSEIRCFAKAGRVLGASRYDYGNDPSEEWLNADSGDILGRVDEFYDKYLAAHYDTVVFDIALNGETPLLIELNPYGLSDPCCFLSYERIESVGGVAIETPPKDTP